MFNMTYVRNIAAVYWAVFINASREASYMLTVSSQWFKQMMLLVTEAILLSAISHDNVSTAINDHNRTRLCSPVQMLQKMRQIHKGLGNVLVKCSLVDIPCKERMDPCTWVYMYITKLSLEIYNNLKFYWSRYSSIFFDTFSRKFLPLYFTFKVFIHEWLTRTRSPSVDLSNRLISEKR